MSSDLPLYHVHVAPDEQPEEAPAVVILHGRGADEEDLLGLARHLPDGIHVLSLRAPDQLMGGYTWYELDLSGGGLHQSQPDPEQFRQSLDLVSETVENAADLYGFDPDRVGLLGFSQGAITSMSLLLEEPDAYVWTVALHGYLPDSHAALDPDGIEGKPVFVGGGTADEIIPAERVEHAADRLREVGADVTVGLYDVGHGIGQEELRDVVAFVERQLE